MKLDKFELRLAVISTKKVVEEFINKNLRNLILEKTFGVLKSHLETFRDFFKDAVIADTVATLANDWKNFAFFEHLSNHISLKNYNELVVYGNLPSNKYTTIVLASYVNTLNAIVIEIERLQEKRPVLEADLGKAQLINLENSKNLFDFLERLERKLSEEHELSIRKKAEEED